MSILKRLSFIVVLVAACQTTLAAVYKCDNNGNITFSDTPCTDNEQDITHEKHNITPKKTTTDSTERTERMQKMADEMESVRITRELNQKIKSLQNELFEVKRLRDKKLLELKDKKESIGVADNYEDELLFEDLKKLVTDEELAVNKQYSAEIETLTQEINNLQSQLKQLKP